MISCVNAAGQYLPSTLIYTKSLPTERYKNLIPQDWTLAWSNTGYITTKLFEQWFVQTFVPRCGATKEKPVLLIMDNCSTHYSRLVIETAIENNIHLLCEPPNTSHLVQPLDKIFGPLKDEFNTLCYSSKVVDAHACINKGNMAVFVNKAQESTWSPSVVKSGWQRTGLHPLD